MGRSILITNLYVANGSGSEAVVELLADGLRRAGHRPMLYAPQLGPQAARMRARGHILFDRLEAMPERPDVLHLQHLPPALAAMAALPDVPAVYSCHSPIFEVEVPLPHPQIRRWIAVSDLGRTRCLSRGVPAERLSVILNAVDLLRFRPRGPLPARPRRALLLTKTHGLLAMVRAACDAAGIALDALGPGVGHITDRLEDELPQYDLVFATGRMALEAAVAGCAVIVGDGHGFAGPLRSAELEAWRRLNLGARLYTRPMTPEGLREAIEAYDPQDAAKVTTTLRATASAEDYAAAHLAVYEAAIADPAPPAAAVTAATAAWLEDLLPTPTRRPWVTIAREIGSLDALLLDEQAKFTGRLAEQIVALSAESTARALHDSEQRIGADLAALPSRRAEQFARALWRRLVPCAIRRPLYRLRRSLLRAAAG
jgi:hypothetical protein